MDLKWMLLAACHYLISALLNDGESGASCWSRRIYRLDGRLKIEPRSGIGRYRRA